MKMNKKQIAAASAVLSYLKSEEDAVVVSRMSAAPEKALPALPAGPTVQVKPWGLSGRHDIMNYRSMMQMKAFHGAKRN